MMYLTFKSDTILSCHTSVLEKDFMPYILGRDILIFVNVINPFGQLMGCISHRNMRVISCIKTALSFS